MSGQALPDPRAHLILREMGHAYGKAKFAGTCPLTGIHITIGSTVRHLVFATRDGRVFDGYVPAKTAELLEFRGIGAEASSRWQRWTPEWLTSFDLGSLPSGTTIKVMEDARGAFDCIIKTWTRVGDVWRSSALGNQTTAQLAAAFRRRTSGAFFLVETPWTP